jgi:hypothetical protein
VLGHYSDSCSLLHSDSTRNPTLVVLSIRLPAIPYSRIPTSLRALCLSALRVLGTPLGCSSQASAQASVSQFILQVRACAFGLCSDLHPHPRYNLNPCHPTPLGGPLGHPLGHPCLALSYEFEPVPSGPARTSVVVCVTSAVRIRTACNMPTNKYGLWNTSVLHTDEDWRHEVEAYLQAVRKFVHAEDIVDCVSQEHLMVCL